LEYAVLDLNSSSRNGEIEMDVLTLCSPMMVELFMRTRARGNKDENDVKEASR
jgi:hypothetical protein